jgi:hypothetical protein
MTERMWPEKRLVLPRACITIFLDYINTIYAHVYLTGEPQPESTLGIVERDVAEPVITSRIL